LDHFIAGPAAYREQRPAQRQPSLDELTADDLVDGVVPPHILAKDLEPAGGIEEPRRVKPAGRFEEALLLAEPTRQRRQHTPIDRMTRSASRRPSASSRSLPGVRITTDSGTPSSDSWSGSSAAT